MQNKLFSQETIFIDLPLKTQGEVFNFIAENSQKFGWIEDGNLIKEALQAREALGTTGFEQGLAIPHCRVATLKEPKIYFLKLKNAIEWEAMDGQPSQYIFSILVPQSDAAGNEHLEILGKLSTGLMDEKIFQTLKSLKTEPEVIQLLNQILYEDQNQAVEVSPTLKSEPETPGDFYVAVSACTFGLSHTYMVEKKLQMYAKEHGFKIKVETHGSKGDKNIITEDDLKKAKGVLIAVDKDLDLRDLEHHPNVYKTNTAEVLKSTQNCFDYLTGVKKQNKTKSELKKLFKIKMPQNFMQTANGMLTFTQWFILLSAIFFLVSFAFVGNQFFQDSAMIIRYASVGVAPIAAFLVSYAFAKSKTTSYCYAFSILAFNVLLIINQQGDSGGLGLFTVLMLLVVPLFFVHVIYKYVKLWLNNKRTLRGGIYWICQLLFVVSMFIILYYTKDWFANINHEIWKNILSWDQKYWLFRWAIAFLFMGMMVIDMGGPLNKTSIIASAILFGDSFAANINFATLQPNVFATPLTAQVLGITIPGVSIWVRSLIIGQNLTPDEKILSKESGRSAFKGISEHALWTYKVYKNTALAAHLLNVLGCALIIGLLHIQFFGGYNTILGAFFGLSFDNVLANKFFNVMPVGMPSFNLGYLILNLVGPLWGGLVYSTLFTKRFKTRPDQLTIQSIEKN